MSFELQYNKLIKHAEKFIDKGSNITAVDVVNDAYLHFYNKPFELPKIEAWIYNQIRIDHSKGNNLFISDISKKDIIIEHDRVCKKCKENLPIAAFYYYWNSRLYKKEISTNCKSCLLKYQSSRREKYNEWRRKKYNSDNEYRLKTLTYNSKYCKKKEINKKEFVKKVEQVKQTKQDYKFDINQLIKIHSQIFVKLST